jgi:hypothetical protein
MPVGSQSTVQSVSSFLKVSWPDASITVSPRGSSTITSIEVLFLSGAFTRTTVENFSVMSGAPAATTEG